MAQKYCYWSVADGRYADMMKRCVASARAVGVRAEFHVMTDTPIEGCECYDAQSVVATQGLYKLVYLKAGMSKLLFDYFIWVDADSLFQNNPERPLDVLGKAPIHVPLLSATIEQGRYAELLIKAGVQNKPHACNAAFWIVKRDAIDRVHTLALHFLAVAKKESFDATADHALGYAMQMLCGNPARHSVSAIQKLWGEYENSTACILHLGTNSKFKFNQSSNSDLTSYEYRTQPKPGIYVN